MTTIYGRNTKQIEEDGLCNLHTSVCKDLNAICANGCLYTGYSRLLLTKLKSEIEKAILEGDTTKYRQFLKVHANIR